jgi:hypothetical protein
MTVEELVAILETLPPDLSVHVAAGEESSSRICFEPLARARLFGNSDPSVMLFGRGARGFGSAISIGDFVVKTKTVREVKQISSLEEVR